MSMSILSKLDWAFQSEQKGPSCEAVGKLLIAEINGLTADQLIEKIKHKKNDIYYSITRLAGQIKLLDEKLTYDEKQDNLSTVYKFKPEYQDDVKKYFVTLDNQKSR